MSDGTSSLTRQARILRSVHNSIGAGELTCLGYLWVCAPPADGIDGWDYQSATYLAREQHWSSPEVVPLDLSGPRWR